MTKIFLWVAKSFWVVCVRRVVWVGVVCSLVLAPAQSAYAQSVRSEAKQADETADDFGNISLWDISGITGGVEGYENQLALVFAPSIRLGRVLSVSKFFKKINLSLELLLQGEISGNEAGFRSSYFSSPSILAASGAEMIAISETGAAIDADSGQVDGTSRRVVLSDLWLGLSHPELYRIPWLLIDAGVSCSFTFPTSIASQVSGFNAGISYGISLSRTLWKKLTLSYGFRNVQYLFSHTTSNIRSLEEDVEVNGRKEPVYQPMRAVVLNPSYGFVNEFSA
ncbi:MAG: hypothetical protein V1754_09135, partial [Pseudomonadota bacterium]